MRRRMSKAADNNVDAKAGADKGRTRAQTLDPGRRRLTPVCQTAIAPKRGDVPWSRPPKVAGIGGDRGRVGIGPVRVLVFDMERDRPASWRGCGRGGRHLWGAGPWVRVRLLWRLVPDVNRRPYARYRLRPIPMASRQASTVSSATGVTFFAFSRRKSSMKASLLAGR